MGLGWCLVQVAEEGSTGHNRRALSLAATVAAAEAARGEATLRPQHQNWSVI
ncbi:mCG146886 [Mus musculus]|nr:mCG146886 [Mus musculus]